MLPDRDAEELIELESAYDTVLLSFLTAESPEVRDGCFEAMAEVTTEIIDIFRGGESSPA